MKSVYILHGRGSSPEKDWIPWLKSNLENSGYEVCSPKLPNSNFPNKSKWYSTLDDVLKKDSSALLIGKSLSCRTILDYISNESFNLIGAILIAPFQTINYETVINKTKVRTKKYFIPSFLGKYVVKYSIKNSKSWCNQELPWDSLKEYEQKLTFFFSNNDPYVSSDQINLFKKNLPNSHYLDIKNAGHFGKEDGYDKFSKLLEVSLNLLK